MKQFELFIALRYLRAKRKQAVISVITMISIVGVAAGVMALIIALAITTVSFDFSLGPVFLIPMIAAAVFGGIGQPYGAMAGGLVVGIASEIAAAYTNPAYKEVVAFAILIVMLLVRPRGLFGAAWSTRKLMA